VFQLKVYQERCLEELAEYSQRIAAFSGLSDKPEKLAFEDKEGRLTDGHSWLSPVSCNSSSSTGETPVVLTGKMPVLLLTQASEIGRGPDGESAGDLFRRPAVHQTLGDVRHQTAMAGLGARQMGPVFGCRPGCEWGQSSPLMESSGLRPSCS